MKFKLSHLLISSKGSLVLVVILFTWSIGFFIAENGVHEGFLFCVVGMFVLEAWRSNKKLELLQALWDEEHPATEEECPFKNWGTKRTINSDDLPDLSD